MTKRGGEKADAGTQKNIIIIDGDHGANRNREKTGAAQVWDRSGHRVDLH